MTAATESTIDTKTVLTIDKIAFNSSSATVLQIDTAVLSSESVDV